LADVSKEELIKAAEVAKIELEEEELIELHARFTALLKWLEPLLEADCSAGRPLLFNHGALNVLRDDRAEQGDLKDLGSSAPNFEDGYYVVPPIIE